MEFGSEVLICVCLCFVVLLGAFTPQYFSHFSSDTVPKCCVHTKKNLFIPFSVPAREQGHSWEKKVPISDWLGGLQTTSRKTPKKFCEAAILLSSH